ncbi:MAG: DUF3298 and DUF4163 domain-containing protein [Actinobacteria bacterium]|nr:DUF3298 and DUF4163 domain-containing protein [Actinomycetota bacterium]
MHYQLNHKLGSVIILILVLAFTISLLSGCGIINSVVNKTISIPNQGQNNQQTASEPESSGTANTSAQNKTAQSTQQETQSQTANGALFFDNDLGFNLSYPGKNIVFSTTPWMAADKNAMLLSIKKIKIEDIKEQTRGYDKETALKDQSELAKGEFGESIDFPFELSKKVIKIGETYAKDFLVLGRYDACDVTFERIIIFYKNDFQVTINVKGLTDKIKDSIPEYFKIDNENCGNFKVWDLTKQQAFYDSLINRKASVQAQEWYDVSQFIVDSINFGTPDRNNLLNKKIVFQNNIISENSTDLNYAINGNYPQLKFVNDENTEKLANKDLFQIVNDGVESFKKDMESMNATTADTSQSTSTDTSLDNTTTDISQDSFSDTSEDTSGIPSYINELDIDYSIPIVNSKVFSILFEYYSYTGGAHGNTITASYNFDVAGKKKLELKDLFKENFDYLKFISDFCIQDIKKQNQEIGGGGSDDKWIYEGAGPDINNFKTFLLTRNALVIMFDPYQVEPYAWGIVEVHIPYSSFMNSLKMDSAISELLQG